jgi:tRNA (cytidine/uridine-2'-O-)-methyltransferase
MLTIKTYDSYEQFLDDNKSEHIYMVSRHGKQTYSDIEYPKGDIYLMFGSESSGIPLDILSVNRDKTLRIPMRPAARSLNLSNSVAIITYEVLRQRRYENLALREVLKGEDYL